MASNKRCRGRKVPRRYAAVKLSSPAVAVLHEARERRDRRGFVFPGRCQSSNRLYVEEQTVAFLEAADDLEEIACLRIAVGTEHTHQALGRLRG